MAGLNEKRIKEILKNYEEELSSNHVKLKSIYQAIEITDNMLKTIGTINNMKDKDVSIKIMECMIKDQQNLEKEYSLDLKNMAAILIEQEKEIQRVWLCYMMLPSQEYELLNRLYVQGKLWTVVREELSLSHRKMVELRKKAMMDIEILYRNNYETMGERNI